MATETKEADFPDGATLGVSAEVAQSDWVVMKFGGSSVASANSWHTIAGLIKNRLAAGLKPLVVHSAVAGVSNALEDLLRDAVAGDPADRLQAIKQGVYGAIH